MSDSLESRPSRAPLLQIALESETPGAGPLYRQLYEAIRRAVLEGRLPPGTRLPPSRTLAKELGCSRNTVMTAYEQLHAEGYLEGRVGAGSFVSQVLPEALLNARPLPKEGGAQEPPTRPLSRRGELLAPLHRARERAPGRADRAFLPGLADPDHFPFDVWSRLLARSWRRPPLRHFLTAAAGGLPELREALAEHLRRARDLDCEAAQLLITNGAQQAVSLAAQLLLNPGETVAMEEPGYPGLRGPLLAAGARIEPVPLDAEGLSVAALRERAPDARMLLVAPSHHYPLCTVMSLKRRLELLDWARECQAWIVEDDYDSEYRYAGRPLAALQALDSPARGGAGRVLYVGSFSKVLFPSLRLGYLVVPKDLAERFERGRAALDEHPSLIAQPALAAFLTEGHFAAHLRRMRQLYAARQRALLNAAEEELAGLLNLLQDEAGLHLVAQPSADLAARMSDREMEARAAERGILVRALSRYYQGTPARSGLLLGYAAVPEERMKSACRELAEALRD
jgi:GntR family transcriptional regulator/MocR family aminotransferase